MAQRIQASYEAVKPPEDFMSEYVDETSITGLPTTRRPDLLQERIGPSIIWTEDVRKEAINVEPSQKYVKWGVQWHHQPLYMVLTALLGVFLGASHHVYYAILSGTLAGPNGRQQWAHAIGNILSILVATSFAVANRIAYKQYFWTVVRRKAYSIKALDALHSLTSDPLGFLQIEIWWNATLAALLATVCW